MESAKIEELKCDILGHFQTLFPSFNSVSLRLIQSSTAVWNLAIKVGLKCKFSFVCLKLSSLFMQADKHLKSFRTILSNESEIVS